MPSKHERGEGEEEIRQWDIGRDTVMRGEEEVREREADKFIFVNAVQFIMWWFVRNGCWLGADTHDANTQKEGERQFLALISLFRAAVDELPGIQSTGRERADSHACRLSKSATEAMKMAANRH